MSSDKKDEKKQRDFSAAGMWESERKLLVAEGLDAQVYEKFTKAAKDASIDKVKKALEDKKHKVTVCATKEEALKVLGDLLPQGASVGFGSSVTHTEIGFIDYVKTRTDLVNYRSKAMEAEAKNDWGTAGEMRRQGQCADYFFTSVSAITEGGELLTADASGSRLGGITSAAKNVVIVAGSNKIVTDLKEGYERLNKFCFPLESRHAHYLFGVEKSMINNTLVVSHGNPWAPNRIHVILMKGAFGY